MHKIMKDTIIKKIFTSKTVGKKLAASIIGSILNIDPKDVLNNLEFFHPEISDNSKIVNSTVDVMLENTTTIINIEFNVTNGEKTNVKNITYIMQLYLKQLKTYVDYEKIKPIIQINIDDYDYFKAGKFIYESMLLETTLHLRENENIAVYHINLQYLDKLDYNKDKEKFDDLAYKLYFIICDDQRLLNKIYKGDELMNEVVKETKQISDGIDWSLLYYNPQDIWDGNVKEAAEKLAKEELAPKIAKDMAQDMAKDMAKDMAQDIAQDIAQDMAHDMAKDMAKDITDNIVNEKLLDVVSHMLEIGISKNDIIKCTGITNEQIDILLKKSSNNK